MPKKTYVTFLLDETGSMESHRAQTIDAFNEYLGTLKTQEAKIRFTLTQFNSARTLIVYNAAPVDQVEPLTPLSYHPQATTPLYDAIMGTVQATEAEIAGRKKAAVLCVILTDGLENASRRHTQRDVFDTIGRKTKEGWTFLYLGADQDAWAVGSGLGIARGNTVAFTKSKIDFAIKAVSDSMGKYMQDSLKQEPIEDFFADVDKSELTD